MAETSTKKLVEDVDNAVRDAYQAVRTALHKVEDLKIAIIRQPDVNTFGPEHDEMYKMYIDLSKRFQTIRDELSVRDNSSLVQPPPQLPPQPPPRPPTPGPTPGPAPDMDEPRIVKPPVQRSKSRPYVLVPPRRSVFNALAPPDNGGASPYKSAVSVKVNGTLQGKRKAVEPKDESHHPRGEKEHHSPIKKVKTSHTRQKINEVVVVESFDRDLSPLTELSSTSSVPPSTGAPPPPECPETPRPNPRRSPALPLFPPLPPIHFTRTVYKPPVQEPEQEPAPLWDTPEPEVNLRRPRSEHCTPQIVLQSLPALDPGPVHAPAPYLVASGSRTDEAKASVNTDKKYKSKSKKKGGPDTQFNMDGALLDRRLADVGPDFEVDNDRITHQQVGPNSRSTMSHIFGGNPQRMISYPSPEKRRAHGFKSALLFPSRRFNPFLPTRIGERGLLFRLDQKLEQWVDNEGGSGPYHLMMHHASDDYCYFGVYEFVRVDPVTRDEWLDQLDQVKDNWVKHALKTNTGEQTRARVLLRRELGREPTRAEVEAVKKDKGLKGRVTAAQIVADFNSGTEQLVVWGMKCIGYNYEFERHLTENLVAANAQTKGK